MPYRDLPRGVRRALRGVLGMIYALGVLGGLSVVVWTPTAVVESIGILVALWSLLTVVGGTGALIAVLRDNYRWELAAVPVLGGGIMMYALTSLLLSFESPTRLPSAAMTTMLALFCMFRALELLGHDRKVRPFLEELEQ